MCKVSLNQELNGIELSFEQKPERAVLDTIKAQGFKWNGKKCVWYAKQTAERLTFAESLGQVQEAGQVQEVKNKINLDDLGNNFPGHYGGAELSRAIREELKRRGVKGCTVKVNHYDSITVTYKAAADDFASIEEARERENDFFRALDHDIYIDGRVTYNDYEQMTEEEREAFYIKWLSYKIEHFSNVYGGARHAMDDRKSYFELSTRGFEKISAILAISNQWNYNRSDPYTDYHDVGYYLDIDIKHPDGFTVREKMTDEERVAYDLEQEKKREEEAAALAKYEQERKEAAERAAAYEKWSKEATERIYNNIQVEDLNEQDQLYITDCVCGIGKENSMEELTETIERAPHRMDCVVDRLVTFTDRAAFDDFSKMFLHDFIFVAGKGGTGTEDVRISNETTLTPEQREAVKWFNVHTVGIVLDDKIQLIIDPQGYNYSRYVYIMSDDSETRNAAQELTKQRKESEGMQDFYFPAPISEQVANIEPGEEITIFQCDGWMLHDINAGRGVVQDVRPGSYAQYTGYYIDFTSGKSVFIHDGRDCLIYDGLQTLPQDVTRGKISENMYQIYTVFDGLFDRVYKYFTGQGLRPVLDTIAK